MSWLMKAAARLGYRMIPLTSEQRRYVAPSFDAERVLPPGAAAELDPRNAKLQSLRARYAALQIPVRVHSRWGAKLVTTIDMRYFRGDNAYLWQYRQMGSDAALKYFVITQYTESIDRNGLLQLLGEDGLFGCWTFQYRNRPLVSRDLLDSIHEIYFLDRHLGLSSSGMTVLDIGAGYGRLAHRWLGAYPAGGAYYCVDAIPESTFLCDYYLRFRGCDRRAQVVALDEIERTLTGKKLDVAVNIHSFSECTYAAIDWWLKLLADLKIRYLMIVPNGGVPFLSSEADGSQRSFEPLLKFHGFRQIASEPKYGDPAIHDLLHSDHSMYLFQSR